MTELVPDVGPRPKTSELDDLVDRYVDALALSDPCLAATMGIGGQEGQLTDYGPEAVHQRAELARSTLRALDGVLVDGPAERVATAVLRERLATEVALADADAHLTMLETLDGPVQRVRLAVGLLDQGADTAWNALLSGIRAVPGTLAGLRESLEVAQRGGRVAPRRQVTRNARECWDLRPYLAGCPPGAATAYCGTPSTRP